MKYFFVVITFFICIYFDGNSQNIIINEIQTSNNATLFDFTGNTPDWIEIFNAGSETIDLANYGLSDVDSLPLKWTFPAVLLQPNSHLLIYASGLDLKGNVLFWETIIDAGDEWKYQVPSFEPSGNWRTTGFDDTSWDLGKSGFGYGDGDDSTVIQKTMSVFLRREFNVADKNEIGEAYLHIDYDDAFVAFINGVEVARSNIGNSGEIPRFDDPADNYNHEAQLFSGGQADEFLIDNIGDLLVNGNNVLAIQVHNHSLNSSDLSAIPIFSIGHRSNDGSLNPISSLIRLIPIGLHTNFKLSSAGEHLILSDPNGDLLDSVFTANIPTDISMGRQPDGTDTWKYFQETTPGYSNNTKGYSTEVLSEIYFSQPGGLYTAPFNLTLSSNNINDSIYFTLDGSEPSKDSYLYSSPISVGNSLSIRSRIIKEGILPGKIYTYNYVIGRYHDLPVVCISTAPENLWDEEFGIYVKGPNADNDFPYFGSNFWQDWERQANITMYEPDGTLAFQLDAGIKIFGAYSRGMDQKSLSIHCRKSYGQEFIKYKIFEDREIDEFKTIILRNSGNDFNNTMLRDGYAGKIVSDLGLDQMAYRPAVLYLNGEYWGIQNIREKINEEFLSSHHRIDEDEISILERNGEVVRGNAEHYQSMMSYLNTHNLSEPATYEYVKSQIDVENFIKYNVAQIFIDNRDWPGNNIKFWRENNTYSKWKWILYDLDFSFNTWGNDNQYFNTLEFALEPNGPGWPNPPWSTFLIRKLIENQSFKHDFINCFADNLNTIFSPSLLEQQLNVSKNEISSEIDDHLQRWFGDKGYWNDRIFAMRSFVKARRGFVRNHILHEFKIPGTYEVDLAVTGNGSLGLNTIHLIEFNWSGTYFDHVPISIQAIPDPKHRFVQWEGLDPEIYKEKIQVNSSADTALHAVFIPVENSEIKIVINEINYNSMVGHNSGDWVELLNVSGFDVNISGWKIRDKNNDNELILPEGTVIENGVYLVLCRDKHEFLTVYPQISIIEKEFDFGLSSSGDCVRLFDGDDILMDEVCYENSPPWPQEPNGGGKSLSLKSALSNNEHPANWTASISYGTPGSINDVITNLDINIKKDNELLAFMYPNPIISHGFIEYHNEDDSDLEICLLDMSGKYLGQTYLVKLTQGLNNIPLDLSYFGTSITNGLYFLQLKTASKKNMLKVAVSR